MTLTQALVAFGKYISGTRPGDESWTELDEEIVRAAMHCEDKPVFSIYNWSILKRSRSAGYGEASQEWYSLTGVSDQYLQGRPVTTSRILNADLVNGRVHTHNSVYVLKEGPFPISLGKEPE